MTSPAAIPLLAPVRENGWLTIWLNQPETRNCLSEAMITELTALLKHVSKEDDLRGVMLRGKSGIFCAGGDLKEFKRFTEIEDPAQMKAIAEANSQLVAELFTAIRELPQITVAVVEGAAMAGGFALACVTDMLVTMDDAKYSLSETRIGLTPAQITPYVVERLGFAQARNLLLLAGFISGEEAHAIGMADFVAFSGEQLEQQLDKIRIQVQGCSPNALAATKTALYATRKLQPAESDKLAAALFSSCLVSEDGKEGVRSFIEKRKPRWDDENYQFHY